MRSRSGRHAEQSGRELGLAVVASGVLHIAVAGAAFFFLYVIGPRSFVPPSYVVKLVGQQPEGEPAAKPEKPQPKPVPKKQVQPKIKKAAPKPIVAVPKKSVMPELTKPKAAQPKHETPEQPHAAQPAPAAQPATAASGTRSGTKTEGVAVSSREGEDFPFPPYMAHMNNKINSNWNPPPGAQGIMAKVQFSILRTGRLSEPPKLLRSSGNHYFDQAAMRAILQCDPFPPMPEGFFRSVAVFTVDLLPKD